MSAWILVPLVIVVILAYVLGVSHGVDSILRRLSLGCGYWKHQLYLYELRAKHEAELREAQNARD